METRLSGDVSKRLALGGGATHQLEVEIEQVRARLAANEAERKELEAALRDLVSRCSAAAADYSSPTIADAPRVMAAPSAAEKIALFRRLFAGRADVFPVRWENRKTAKSGYAPACANEWVKGICGKPQVKCGECPHQAFIQVTDDIIEKHLRGEGARGSGGDFVAGVYPLLPDETCWFLAADFDEESWAADALAVLETCQAKGVPAALERSRSGNGGPVRHRVDPRAQAAGRGIVHRAKTRSTEFQLPPPLAASDRPSMPAVYAAIAQDESRNNLIFDDVLKALEARRSPIVLTERRDHLEYLHGRFSRFVRNLVVLRGGMSAVERKASDAALRVANDQERLILATGRYIGEGFDDPRLDALFLTMPISWKGTLAQYVGRLHRQHAGKTEVLVVDYVDDLVPILARMAAKRRSGYRALGYRVENRFRGHWLPRVAAKWK